jgi:hypothetical protein
VQMACPQVGERRGSLSLTSAPDAAVPAATPRGGSDRLDGDGTEGALVLPSPKSRTRAVAAITSQANTMTCTDGQNCPELMARHAPTTPVAIVPSSVRKKTCTAKACSRERRVRALRRRRRGPARNCRRQARGTNTNRHQESVSFSLNVFPRHSPVCVRGARGEGAAWRLTW